MKCILAALALAAAPLAGQVLPGHRLPEGPERPVREREIDIERYTAELRFDMQREEVRGTATLTFAPLRARVSKVSLDAAGLAVSRVERDGKPQKFSVSSASRKLTVDLAQPLEMGQTAALSISYSTRPRSGLYFFPGVEGRAAQAWNYGEGGLHYGWLPIYNDVNDKFAVEFRITVDKPYTAVSNGRLAATKENPDGTRTFCWIEDKPIPNYLMTVDVGEFSRVALEQAELAGGTVVPLAVWTPPATEEAARHTFGRTPAMVEFFSERFGYPYPWPKYDQVLLREFAVGAMETTSATGFKEASLHRPGDPPDDGPDFDEVHPVWTYEDTIAHELAHHWFGDLVTCRSIGSIWLNESFASYCHTLWNGKANGEDDLTYQRWRYLNEYLDYVHAEGTVRPMEFFRYDDPGAMYQTETTYIKGSLVLHLLRRVVGDAEFYRALSEYLHEHEYGNVESADLRAAFEKSCGLNLSWFFEDWVSGGGGHPSLEVSWRYVPERREVDLTVRQIQADLAFENDFRLPVEVEVVTSSGAAVHRVELSGWKTRVSLPARERPRRVVFDKGGWLIAEVRFDRPAQEVLDELARGDLAGRLRAARQLASDFPRHPETVPALARLLSDRAAHWGLRQEAAWSLGMAGGEAAGAALVQALSDADRRIRRAAAVALGHAGVLSAASALRRAVETEKAEDVAAASAIALGRLRAPGAAEFLKKQLGRESRYWDAIRVGALQGLAKLHDPALIPVFEPYLQPGHSQDVRLAALQGWLDAAPEDARLGESLRLLTRDRNRGVRATAIETLGKLHHAEDVKPLREIAESDPDPSIAQEARDALEEIEAFTEKEKR
jgi:aminopeptidase N